MPLIPARIASIDDAMACFLPPPKVQLATSFKALPPDDPRKREAEARMQRHEFFRYASLKEEISRVWISICPPCKLQYIDPFPHLTSQRVHSALRPQAQGLHGAGVAYYGSVRPSLC